MHPQPSPAAAGNTTSRPATARGPVATAPVARSISWRSPVWTAIRPVGIGPSGRVIAGSGVAIWLIGSNGVAIGARVGVPAGVGEAKNETSKLGRSVSRGPSHAITTTRAPAPRTRARPRPRRRDRPGPPRPEPPEPPIRCGATAKPWSPRRSIIASTVQPDRSSGSRGRSASTESLRPRPPIGEAAPRRSRAAHLYSRPMNVLDLRSDTVTHPTDEMRRAMATAEVGDDVWREDPTVNALEERAAELLGKEAGLFVSTGTMGNLVSLVAHVPRGGEIIAGAQSHIVRDEAAGHAVVVGASVLQLDDRADGTLDLDDVAASFRDPSDPHEPITALVAIENAHSHSGNQPVSLDATRRIAAVAHDR